MPACPNYHGRKFSLVVQYLSVVEAGRHNLHMHVLIGVTLHTTMPRTITSFDSQTPMYITASTLSDEYREVVGDIPFQYSFFTMISTLYRPQPVQCSAARLCTPSGREPDMIGEQE